MAQFKAGFPVVSLDFHTTTSYFWYNILELLQVLLEAISRHRKVKVANGNSKHRFTKDKSYLTILTACCDAMSSLVGERTS